MQDAWLSKLPEPACGRDARPLLEPDDHTCNILASALSVGYFAGVPASRAATTTFTMRARFPGAIIEVLPMALAQRSPPDAAAGLLHPFKYLLVSLICSCKEDIVTLRLGNQSKLEAAVHAIHWLRACL